MDLSIKNKVALVTGAGRGIGQAICKSLAKEGVKVIATSRTEKDLLDLVLAMGGSEAGHRHFALDITAFGGPEELVRLVQESGCAPDIVVNNVGGNLGFTDPLCDVDEWQQVMRVNVEVAVEINRAFIPGMQKKKWGRICHISSIAALENQGPPSYCAAKAALNAYVRSLGRFVSPDNVILTTVMPGAIFTKDGYWDNATRQRPDHVHDYLNNRMAIKRFGQVEEISELVTFLCSEHASFCVGTGVLADGGQGRLFYPND